MGVFIMTQFHIYKIQEKYKPDIYQALKEGFSWYGLFFSVVWLCITCIKRDKLVEGIFLLLFVFTVIGLFLTGLILIDGVVFNQTLGLGNIIVQNPTLDIVIGLLFSHIFLGFKGNSILRWAYQNDEHLGIVTASTEHGAITLFKQNQNINE